MELTKLKIKMQEHFTDGLVTIVGSGLSVAEGIPGMAELTAHLLKHVPDRLDSASKPCWTKIADYLNAGTDLESTLLSCPPDPSLESLIVELTANLIQAAEATILRDAIEGTVQLRFSRLIGHMLKPRTGIPVITTNYDRLIELAVELEGLGLDTLFVGSFVGTLNPDESRYSLCRGVKKIKKEVVRTYATHAVILKPHGSLGWYMKGNVPVRCPAQLPRPLIITPGLNKYQNGYNRPFDTHRNRANQEIDRATRFLVIGYGFNDDHLQTHLVPRIRDGIPTLILTHKLSSKARLITESAPAVIALSCSDDSTGTIVTTKGTSEVIPSSAMWDLARFVEEVLQP
jgi:hypothetical protein